MIVCSNCKHSNMDGSMFCAECGAQLVGKDAFVTQNISTEEFKKIGGQKPVSQKFQPLDEGDSWGSLHLLDTGQVIPLSGKNEFTLGRVSEGQPIMPDIDLSAYQAYAAGVSRLHAIIKRNGDQFIYMDLGSANGSFIGGRRLAPNTEEILKHGDIVSLGKLKIQALMKN
ncbi:MAG: FHA domain-containing protein [Anaerolineales bacterium]